MNPADIRRSASLALNHSEPSAATCSTTRGRDTTDGRRDLPQVGGIRVATFALAWVPVVCLQQGQLAGWANMVTASMTSARMP